MEVVVKSSCFETRVQNMRLLLHIDFDLVYLSLVFQFGCRF